MDLEKQDDDYSHKMGTNKVFIFLDEYLSAMKASQKKKLKRYHVVVSEKLVPLVKEVIGRLPHKDNVRVIEEQIFAYLIPDGGGGSLELVTTRGTFLEAPSCTRIDSRSVVTDPVH